jgi:SAM-dependent methyltransferase
VPDYALLVLPAANRVYAEAAPLLVRAELDVMNQAVLGGRLGEAATTTLGGVPYLTFEGPPLTDRDRSLLSTLSSIYALFERHNGHLVPIDLIKPDRFDDDLLTIQRYPGRTNEHFTKLLLNVTLLSSAFAAEEERRLAVIDPLCGRGTTLNQALMYGFDAAGIEIDGRDFDAYATFLTTWLKQKRLKHKAAVSPVRRNGRTIARRLDVTVGETKEAYRAGEALRLGVVNADTVQALEHHRPASFDIAVTDLAYGVRHGSRTAGTLSRSPLDLLVAAVPVWAALLRPGGALGLAWNTHVAPRADAARILESSGLRVLDEPPYRGFAHRVEQAIMRDVLVARR